MNVEHSVSAVSFRPEKQQEHTRIDLQTKVLAFFEKAHSVGARKKERVSSSRKTEASNFRKRSVESLALLGVTALSYGLVDHSLQNPPSLVWQTDQADGQSRSQESIDTQAAIKVPVLLYTPHVEPVAVYQVPISLKDQLVGTPPPETNLDRYMKEIKSEMDRVRPLFEKYDVYAWSKNISKEERMKDFETYFPIWYAAQLKYGVSWVALMGIQLEETTVSRSLNPDHGPYRGAFQINVGNLQQSYEKSALSGYEFLTDVKGLRYPNAATATNDAEQTMQAAAYIRRVAEIDYGVFNKDTMYKVLAYNYSDSTIGERRVRNIKRIEQLIVSHED